MKSEARRRFLTQSVELCAAVLATTVLPRRVSANPLGKPAGIQLYTVNQRMKDDPAGTLQKLRAIGYGEVESAGFGELSSKQFRKLLDDAGLRCPSAHLSFDLDNLNLAFEDAHALGAHFAASGSLDSLFAGPKRAPAASRPPMTLEAAKRIAEIANRIGEAARRAGLTYAYHNHDSEFADQGGGRVAYDVLLQETHPDDVKFEIDCGWMIFAGRDPIDYFRKHPGRFPVIHVKDYLARPGDSAAHAGAPEMLGAELGTGVVDYKPIFAAARKAGLRHYFVEQEGPFSRMEPLAAARVDYDYLQSIG